MRTIKEIEAELKAADAAWVAAWDSAARVEREAWRKAEAAAIAAERQAAAAGAAADASWRRVEALREELAAAKEAQR